VERAPQMLPLVHAPERSAPAPETKRKRRGKGKGKGRR